MKYINIYIYIFIYSSTGVPDSFKLSARNQEAEYLTLPIIYKHTYRGIQNISNNKHALAARTAMGLRRRRGVQGCPGEREVCLYTYILFTYVCLYVLFTYIPQTKTTRQGRGSYLFSIRISLMSGLLGVRCLSLGA